MNNNNESSNSSRSSTLTSYNWIRRSFEDLDIEVVQTEIMQKRKRKDSNHHQQQLTMERKHPLLSFSSSLNSEQFYNKDARNSKAVPYGDKDASNCFECRRMLGQVIDDANGIPRQTETSSYPCECPVTEVSCCDNCCSSGTSNKDFDEIEDAFMEDIDSKKKVKSIEQESTSISESKLKKDHESTQNRSSIIPEMSKPTTLTIPLLRNASLERFQETSTSTNL